MSIHSNPYKTHRKPLTLEKAASLGCETCTQLQMLKMISCHVFPNLWDVFYRAVGTMQLQSTHFPHAIFEIKRHVTGIP